MLPVMSNQGMLGKLADAELEPYRLVKSGTDEDHVAYIAAVTDIPMGVTHDGCDAAEDDVSLKLLEWGESVELELSGTIAVGGWLCPAVDGTGKARPIPSTGQVYVCARANQAGVSGDIISVQTFTPFVIDCGVGVAPAIKSIVQSIDFDDLTDGESTSGTLNLTVQLPAGALPIGCKAVVGTGFTGDTSAVLDVGTSGDPDAFGDNVSVLAAGTVYANPAATNTVLSAATTVQVTVTGAADFTSISAGSMTLTVYYIQL